MSNPELGRASVTPRGIYSFPAEQYFAASGVSKSMLDKIAISPAHLQAHLAEPKEPTPAMIIGAIAHRAILEPDTFKDAFYVRPENMKFTTRDGIAWKEEHNDKPILAHEEAVKIQKMVDAVHTHPSAKRLFSNGKSEQSLFVEDSKQTLRKSRLDWLSEKGSALPDLKTCESARTQDFEKSIWDYRYFVQAAYYLANCKLCGIDKKDFVFVCVEKSAPYAVACHALDDVALEAGRMVFERDLQVYRNCVESGKWPAYSDGIESIAVPAWAMKTLEAMSNV